MSLLPLVFAVFAGCVEPIWTDERVYMAMKTAAGPSAIGRSVIPMLQDCVDQGQLDQVDGLALCTVAHTDGGNNVLSGTMSWENEGDGPEAVLFTTFEGVLFGSGEHSGAISGTVRVPTSPSGKLELEDVSLTVNGDPFEHWTDEHNEFLVVAAPQALTYASWKGPAPGAAAWSNGSGTVEFDGEGEVELGVWASSGPACFDTLPMSRFEVEADELDLVVEPTDWDSCTACWSWSNDAGETGELCLNDVL